MPGGLGRACELDAFERARVWPHCRDTRFEPPAKCFDVFVCVRVKDLGAKLEALVALRTNLNEYVAGEATPLVRVRVRVRVAVGVFLWARAQEL